MELNHKKLDLIIEKWKPLLGIRGTIFGINGNGEKTVQVQLNAFNLEKLENGLIEEALPLFYVELREFFGPELEILFVKMETLDFASHIFWDLASLGLEPTTAAPLIFFPPSKYPNFYT